MLFNLLLLILLTINLLIEISSIFEKICRKFWKKLVKIKRIFTKNLKKFLKNPQKMLVKFYVIREIFAKNIIKILGVKFVIISKNILRIFQVIEIS